MIKQEVETIGKRLRQFMTRKDITLVAVAQATGLNIRTIWTVVHDRHVPNPRTEYKIMRFIGEIND